jgi:hypothetical protein
MIAFAFGRYPSAGAAEILLRRGARPVRTLPLVTCAVLSLISCSPVPPQAPETADTADLSSLPPDTPDEVYAPTDAEDQRIRKAEEVEAEGTEPAPVETENSAGIPEPTRSPAQAPDRVITTGGVVFVLDYDASDLKRAIDSKCPEPANSDTEDTSDSAEKASEAAEKLAKCRQKGREGFQADALRFTQRGPGDLTWTIYRQNGEDLTEVYSVPFEVTEQTASSVTLGFKGQGTGKRPLFRGKSDAVVEVPNTYSIVVKDPEFGRLVYTARYGLAGRSR